MKTILSNTKLHTLKNNVQEHIQDLKVDNKELTKENEKLLKEIEKQMQLRGVILKQRELLLAKHHSNKDPQEYLSQPYPLYEKNSGERSPIGLHNIAEDLEKESFSEECVHLHTEEELFNEDLQRSVIKKPKIMLISKIALLPKIRGIKQLLLKTRTKNSKELKQTENECLIMSPTEIMSPIPNLFISPINFCTEHSPNFFDY